MQIMELNTSTFFLHGSILEHLNPMRVCGTGLWANEKPLRILFDFLVAKLAWQRNVELADAPFREVECADLGIVFAFDFLQQQMDRTVEWFFLSIHCPETKSKSRWISALGFQLIALCTYHSLFQQRSLQLSASQIRIRRSLDRAV